jgi:pseudouridine-5'-phosphate glycosidase
MLNHTPTPAPALPSSRLHASIAGPSQPGGQLALPSPWLSCAPEVEEALERGAPVVALESTIIAHGMPYPHNVETAVEVEQIIRDHGATPATIAVMGGRIRVGLSNDELEQLATSRQALKVSHRDLAHALSQGGVGATTVAGTLACAHLAGIPVFVTGGIGGVHREASRSFDISADLQALAQTPVAVVCAGAKSILDIPLTLEYLETHGVPVVSVGQDAFPAFYCASSGLNAPLRRDTPEGLAALAHTHWALGLRSSLVVACPVPAEAALSEDEVEFWIEQALIDAAREGISGKGLTPYLLARIQHLSLGRSLAANVALVKNNAAWGAQMACALVAARAGSGEPAYQAQS